LLDGKRLLFTAGPGISSRWTQAITPLEIIRT
jgi:hypothetical protein